MAGTSYQIENHVGEVKSKIVKEARDRMSKAVNEARTQVLETLSGSRTGRRYRIPGTCQEYTASAPGEPPAQRLGELRQSVSTQVDESGLIGYIGTNKEYGKHLEYGTSKMAARPWLRTSLEKAEDKIISILDNHWSLGGFG